MLCLCVGDVCVSVLVMFVSLCGDVVSLCVVMFVSVLVMFVSLCVGDVCW